MPLFRKRRGDEGRPDATQLPLLTRLKRRQLSAPQLFVLSFAALVVFGTLGLKLLPGLYTGEPLGWLDALFTSTSAVCVTGLIVVDTATVFTMRGQAFILLLIQLGGLGIITFTSLVIVAMGKRLSLRQEAVAMNTADIAPHVEQKHLLRNVVFFTLGIEAVGAILLYFAWLPRFGWRDAMWPAVFHSVSAFCNAGFSTNSDSLMSDAGNPFVLWIVMGLIVLGGIGFLTLEESYLFWKARRKKQRFRLSLHSRLALVTTLVLIVVGWFVFLGLEWEQTLKTMNLFDKSNNALFMSVTARTAGFNSIDYAHASGSTNFFTIVLMSIGGSPGSTAGGLKTTTVAIIALVAWSRFRGRSSTSVAGRSIPDATIQRAIGLFAIVFTLITVSIFALSVDEPGQGGSNIFLSYMFEAVSAFNTVGLSMGLTPQLGAPDRLLVIFLMFAGRVGPLVLAAALTRSRDTSRGFRYAHEDVMVG